MRAAVFLFYFTCHSFVIAIVGTACDEIDNCVDCIIKQGTRRCLQCKNGYYINSTDICSPCQSNCITCVSWNNCSGCVAGYYGRWCSEQCDTNCVQAECTQNNGTCVHGCRYGYVQAGQQCLLCSDFIPNCEECSDIYHCTKCVSGYNVWPFSATTYCDVGCPSHTWGVMCQYNCSSNCASCDETNGHCHSCTRYTYGEACQFRCSDGCYDSTDKNVCERQTGQCIYGCKPGYTGTTCETVNHVDAQWSHWSEYGPCSVTCGSGSRTRNRSCNNPSPQNGEQHCVGNDAETADCNVNSCQFDGQWGQWSMFGPCSVTCGSGSMSRTRSCDKPAEENGGQACIGTDTETANCLMTNCSDTSDVAAENDSVAVVVGGVFGGAVLGFVGGLCVGYCIYKRKCWRRGKRSSDDTYTPPSMSYVNIIGTTDGVTVSGNESDVPAYESLDRKAGPDPIYTGLETGTF